jgi:hypothetical protein
MTRKVDKGQVFGRLTARAADPENKKPGMHWWFHCSCGEYKSIRLTNVLNRRTQSCGCLKREYVSRLQADLKEVTKLREALKLALKCLSEPGCYQRFDNEVKTINDILYGRTGE